MSKQQANWTAAAIDRSQAAASQPYDKWIDDMYKASGGNNRKRKDVTNIDSGEIKKWKTANPNTPEGQIVNSIVGRLNSVPLPTGIEQVKYGRAAGQNNLYEGATQGGKTKLTLNPPNYAGVKEGPDPSAVMHELVHAGDHQRHYLTPKIWKLIGELATGKVNGVQTNSAMKDFDELDKALLPIQNKIDRGGAFSTYPPDVDPLIPGNLMQKYIEHEMTGLTGNAYTVPMVNNGPDWDQLFSDIDAGLTAQNNPEFFLNYGSEYPAYIVENLARNWQTGQKVGNNPALTDPQARIAYNMLGHLNDAYPAADYVEPNSYIQARRKSITDAFHPAANPALPSGTPGALPDGWYSNGGRVTGKNLLARFIKPKRKAS